MTTTPHTLLPAEWQRQSGIILTWPHQETDWAEMLDEVESCYIALVKAITAFEPVLIISPETELLRTKLAAHISLEQVQFFNCPSNDTWTRDHGPITVIRNNRPFLTDFTFNGWGMKFAARYDNLITRRLHSSQMLRAEYINALDFVLEGGSIESDGEGTILTTSACLLSENRNDTLDKQEIEQQIANRLGAERVLWLHHGYLQGDDTDSHIDTLARFCSPNSIAYVCCEDTADPHYSELKKMEEEILTLRTKEGKPYQTFALPMPKAVMHQGERLPATYANFLIINRAVVMPTYNQPETDNRAAALLQKAFPDRTVICVDATPLIKQHGSIHCVTMQLPEGVLPPQNKG